jgi:hypothetical protein
MNAEEFINNWESNQLALIDPRHDLLTEIRRCKLLGYPTEHLGQIFLSLSESLVKRLNLREDLREDFISGGVLDALQYYSHFDEERSDNPIAYILQIIKNSFAKSARKFIRYENTIHI